MRIAIWGINYYPERVGIGPHTAALSEFLASRGHEVRVHTAFPYYPAWEKDPPDARRLFLREKRNGVQVVRTWHYVPKQPSPLRRVCHELSFGVFSLFPLLSGPVPDVLLVISPPLTLGFLAALWRSVSRVPLVVHVQDLQPDAAIALGMLRNPALQTLSRFAERVTYRFADRVSTISRGMLDAIARKGVDSRKLVYLPNGFDPPALPAAGQFRRRQGIPDNAFLLVYSGNLGAKQGLDKLLAAARSLPPESVRIVICGDGPMRPAVLSEMRTNPVIHAISLLPDQEYREMLADCDLYVVCQQTKVPPVFFPSKILPALAAGRPILALASRDSELARFIGEHDLGKVADEEDGAALAAQVMALRENREARERFSRNTWRVKHEFDRAKIFPPFERQLLSL